VTLNAVYFNAKIAPVAASDPPVPVYFDIWVNSTTPGTVAIGSLFFNLSFPDELRSYFSPSTDTLQLDVGEAQTFLAAASTSPGVGISYAWELDGATAGTDSPAFTFAATAPGIGMHSVAVNVTNGQFTAAHVWSVEVRDTPIFGVGVFFPSTRELDVPTGTSQDFAAAWTNASLVSGMVEWSLDGSPAGTGPTFTFDAPDTAGDHTVGATVVTGTSMVTTTSFTWTVHVTDVPGAVSHALAATFSPTGDVQVDFGASVDLTATLTSPPPGVHYQWYADGSLVGTDSATFSYGGTTAGSHVVSVVASTPTAVAANQWTILVGAEPLPAGPTVAITSPTQGSAQDAGIVHVTGTGTPGATVSVNGVSTTISAGGVWAVDVGLFSGANTLTATVRDSSGQTSTASVSVTYTPPEPDGGAGAGSADTTLYLVLIIVMACIAGLMAFMWMQARGKGG
jgi:hypothetical protein